MDENRNIMEYNCRKCHQGVREKLDKQIRRTSKIFVRPVGVNIFPQNSKQPSNILHQTYT